MSWGEIAVSFAVGVTSALLARPILLGLGGVVQSVVTDVPNVSGKWKSSYSERLTLKEQATGKEATLVLHQFGRLVWGKETVGDPHREFPYSGYIRSRTLFATYKRLGAGNSPTGSGAVQLKIADDDKKMQGACLWHDKDTQTIEHSSYTAVKDA